MGAMGISYFTGIASPDYHVYTSNGKLLPECVELLCRSKPFFAEVKSLVERSLVFSMAFCGQVWMDTDNRTESSSRQCKPVFVGTRPCSLSSPCLAANGALSLLNLACYFLDRQVERLAQDFEKEGGFTERLYRVRTAKRRNNP